MAPQKKSLKDSLRSNPSALGDPVSLKAETSDSQHDKPSKEGDKSLKQRAEEALEKGNASMLGDPVSLKAETADSEPTPDDRGARGGRRGSKL